MNAGGRIVAIHLASDAGAPMTSVTSAVAIAGRGLEGDRYAVGRGHWSPIRRAGDQLTLIEAEEVERAAAAADVALPLGVARRNITTRGIRLDELIGSRFRIGEVTCIGVRRCEPCTYLDGLLGERLLEALVHRAGIRVEIVEGGALHVGDTVDKLPEA